MLNVPNRPALDFIALEVQLATINTGASPTTGLVELFEGTARLPLEDKTCCITAEQQK